jgi:hypothetical protein
MIIGFKIGERGKRVAMVKPSEGMRIAPSCKIWRQLDLKT